MKTPKLYPLLHASLISKSHYAPLFFTPYISHFSDPHRIFPDISAKSLVDAQTESLLKSHKMVFIEGQPSDSSTKAYIDSIRMARTPPVAKMVRCESFSFLFFLICVNIY